jgi:acetolactate synthase-1/3 small subunit
MSSTNTFVALLQDRPGALNRVVSLLRRRGLNIESLTVQRTEQFGVSQMTLVLECETVAPILAQMEKLIDVLEVRVVHTDGEPSPSAGPARRNSAVPAVPFSQADGVSY